MTRHDTVVAPSWAVKELGLGTENEREYNVYTLAFSKGDTFTYEGTCTERRTNWIGSSNAWRLGLAETLYIRRTFGGFRANSTVYIR